MTNTILAPVRSGSSFYPRTAKKLEPSQPSYVLSEPDEPLWADQPLVIQLQSEHYLPGMLLAFNKLRSFLDLPEGWDSYGGLPIRASALKTAMKLLCSVAAANVRPPSVVPTSAGGVQLEWHTNQADLELAVDPHGSVEVFLDMHDSETWEGPLPPATWHLQRFLKYVDDNS